MNSLDLVRHLHRNGTLDKEAALGVLRTRERLIKQALRSEAQRLCENLFSHDKVASVFGSLGRKAPPRGFFSKLRQGSLTPAKEPAAAWSDVGSNLIKMLGIAGLSAGAAAGAGALLRHRRDRQLEGDVERSYKQMFDEYPRLSEMDPERVRTRFDVLARFAPSLAAEPIVAGQFLERTLNADVLDPQAIKALAETQRRIDEMHEGRSPFSQHFDRGLTMAQRAMNPTGSVSKPL